MSDELQYDDQPTMYEQWHAAASECDSLRTTLTTLRQQLAEAKEALEAADRGMTIIATHTGIDIEKEIKENPTCPMALVRKAIAKKE
jgi:hypothetical protein